MGRMNPLPSENVTELLLAGVAGQPSAFERLLPLVYEELRALARSCFRNERPDLTLQPTALVHEAFMRLVDQTQVQWQGRAHFMAVAATAMRRILTDEARKRNALRRGGDHVQVTLDAAVLEKDRGELDVVALDEALTKLASLHARQARVVELRFLGGMSVDDVAAVLEISPRTVEMDWRTARAWLHAALVEGRDA
jgi:RNA polymerase sigma factor (TIGR02999 family)